MATETGGGPPPTIQGQLISTGSNTARAVVDRFAEVTNVMDFGAVGDGVADDTASIRSAIRYAITAGTTSGPGVVFFPLGTYRITSSGLLNDINLTSQNGLSFVGWNHRGTILDLDISTGTAWFYNNVSTARMQFCAFHGLTFRARLGYGNGFNLYSTGHEQAFHWHNCRFENMDIGFRFDGSGNADRSVWNACHFYNINDLVHFNNTQSVAHEFIGCDAQVNANLWYVDAGGGGDVSWFGGSIVMENGTTTPAYAVKVNTSASLGGGNGLFNFYHARFELNSAYKGLVSMEGAAGVPRVNFHGCSSFALLGGARDGIRLAPGKAVVFRDSVYSSELEIRFVSGTLNLNQAQNTLGTVLFDGCQGVSPPSSSWINYDSNTYGQVICTRGVNFLGSSLDSQEWHYNWKAAGQGTGIQRKYSNLLVSTNVFPFSATGEQSVLLPEGATIVGIHVYKNAAGSNPADYRLLVGNNDKTTVYGTSFTLPQASRNYLYLNDLWVDVGTTTNNRTVRLWSEGALTHDGSHTGFAVVEYI